MNPTTKTSLAVGYWTYVAHLFTLAIVLAMLFASTEKTMGPIQKVFYLHVPSAASALVACLVAFVGGIGYLWQRRMAWDSLSAAGAKTAALLCTVALISGMYWARQAWGAWWVWTPRLTLTLMLWLLFVTYLLVRSSIESRQRRAVISAVYAVAAFVDVPLVYFSTRLIPEPLHPVSVTIDLDMKVTLTVWFAAVILATIGLIAALHGRAQRQVARELARAESRDAAGEDGSD
ncbi:MAG: cytochrome c biogenesis protein CcsA [Planctomycetota bacterium]